MAVVGESAKANLTKSANIQVAAREIDFVTRFGDSWKALQEILGITRPITKANGTVLKSKYAEVTLASGNVAEGEEIPYSLAKVKTKDYATIELEKYSKAVSIEAVAEHGAEYAIQMTDKAFLDELRGNVLDRFYTYLQTGTLTGSKATFQAAVANAIGLVKDKFKKMRKSVTEVVVFVNTMDLYDYLGNAQVTVQSSFGLDYIENFMGARRVIVSSEIAPGKVIATPVDNIVLYKVNPADSEFAQLGLEFRVDGITNLIGFHANGDYRHMVGESFALMGMTLMAEYIDGISVVTINGGLGA